ncbi:MAG TPA: hypothetical protein VKX28_22185 [Xanthobacteraceae bacterium]|nr:hypothetical protein [Xanthobacteraceae bacterium]
MAQRRFVLWCAGYLAAIWIIAVLPFAAVLLEFGGIPLCPGTSLGWFIATLYGSFFIYPIAIGGLSMAALVLPLATALSLPRTNRPIYLFVAFYVVTTLVICALEFMASPDGLFQVTPQAILGSPAFLGGLRKACMAQQFADYPRLFPSLVGHARTYTGALYYPGFLAQALMQNALFTVFLSFLFHPKAAIEKKAPYLSGAIFYILGYAIFLGSIWCLFRLSYRNDMAHWLNNDNPFVGDYAIVALYLLVLAVFVLYFQFDLEKFAKTISQIAQFLVFVGGVAVVKFDKGDNFFGVRASVWNIFALFLLFIFVSALTLAFLLRPPQKKKR